MTAVIGELNRKGPKGDKGEPGEMGPRGFQGAPGTNGANGAPGLNGTNGVGVPMGGTTGQVLAKNSGADYDTEWVDQSGGTAVLEPTFLRLIQVNQGGIFTIVSSAVMKIIQGTTQANIFLGNVTVNADGSFTSFSGSDSEIRGL